jgi:hypothetical protein
MASFWDSCPPSGFLNEADVEQRLILPLLYALGYEFDDVVPKYPVVFREGRRGRKPEADFVCFKAKPHDRSSSLIVVEAKAPNEALQDGKLQGESYAANLRSPVLLMTNGSELEVWQFQSTKESDKIVGLAVADLLGHRGELEAVLSKKALVALCERLDVKSFSTEARRHKAYLKAEAERSSQDGAAISRTLRPIASGGREISIASNQLISAHPEGAVILAPSGYGKSTFADQLLRQTCEESLAYGETLLPFLVSLPAIEHRTGALLNFMRQRLAAHSPGVTGDMLGDSLREFGGVLICDSFDRVPTEFHLEVQSELSNFIRDFPLVQVFVLSRGALTPELRLPVFELAPLSTEELRDLEELVLGTTEQAAFVSSQMPRSLRNICENVLVARLVFEYWKEHRRLPIELGSLFRAWLDRIWQGIKLPKGNTVWLESALIGLAAATIDAPIKATKAALVLKDQHLDPFLINELIECDALRANGVSLEIQHEALADYLRTVQLVSLAKPELVNRLSMIALRKDSLFPALLMSQLGSRQLQAILWKRMSQIELDLYLDALRYRFDLSEELEKLDQITLSRNYLEDLLDGIEIPVDAFCPQMRKAIIRYLTQEEDEKLAVTGIVHGPPLDEVEYGFRGDSVNTRVIVSRPERQQGVHSTQWLHLGRSGYRLDSGRLLGATRLRDTLLKVIENQQLEGGKAWIAERLVGRVWHLQRSHALELDERDPLETLEQRLNEFAGKWVPYGDSSREWFSVDTMLKDIRRLRRSGMAHIDFWWRDCGWVADASMQTEETVKRVLDQYFRRRQLILKEVIEESFPRLAPHMRSYTSLPERWDITLTPHFRAFPGFQMHARWAPTVSWVDAGADVRFADCSPAWPNDAHLRESLQKLGRPADRFIIEWNGPLPSFEGYWWDGRFPSTTALVREVCDLVKKEIEYLFSALPSNELQLK